METTNLQLPADRKRQPVVKLFHVSGYWFWDLVAGNGVAIAQSAGYYTTRDKCLRGLRTTIELLGIAHVIDEQDFEIPLPPSNTREASV